MKGARGIAVALLLTAVASAGCLGGGSLGDANTTDSGNVTDTPDGATAGPGERPHVHDRWNGKDEVTVVDRTVDTGSAVRFDPDRSLLGNALCNVTCPAVIEFAPREGNIVPPGTAKVSFTATWNASAPPANTYQVSVFYMAANMTGFESLASTIASGSTYTLNTTVEMADGGHARQSLWQFRITLSQCAVVQDTYLCSSRRTDPRPFEVDVTVRAHRVNGTLPKEPPHPDWWANGSARTVATAGERVDTVGAAAYYANLNATSSPTESVGYTYERLPGDEIGPVPPGTKVLAARVNWTNDAPTASAAGVQPWMVYGQRGGNPFGQRWVPDHVGNGTALFVQPIQPNQTDGMYNRNRSRWAFVLGFEGERDTGVEDPLFPAGSITGPYRFDGRYELEIRAFNTTRLPDAWTND